MARGSGWRARPTLPARACRSTGTRCRTRACSSSAREAAEGTIGTVGAYTPAPSAGKYRGAGVGPSPAYSYSACVAEVGVDPATGIVRVPKIWIAHDVGRAINAATVMGQIEGSVYMGLGEALVEETAYRGNRHVGPK